MIKGHWIRDDQRTGHPRKIITHCGMEGWAGGGSEFVTTLAHRFDAFENFSNVTCKRCLRSAARIEKSPWGCKR